MNHVQHRARKRFGQNFLVDTSVIHQIIRTIQPGPDQNLVEIGPGQGALTQPLLTSAPALTVIEIDRDLIALLDEKFSHEHQLKICQGDALQFDFRALKNDTRPLRIIGNLPYNISTPLLFHLLSFRDIIQDMHFMLQKEVVDRLAAIPGEKHYGRLSVMVQYYCQVQPVFTVPASAFKPAPKVESAIVRLKPYKQVPFTACDPIQLSRLVNSCFQQRRKTLRNCLKVYLGDRHTDTLTNRDLGVDLTLRPEQLTIEQFANLTNLLYNPNSATVNK